MENNCNESQALTNNGFEKDDICIDVEINGDLHKARGLNHRSQGKEIIFHNVCYTVPVKIKGKKIQKEILKNVSGILKPGLNAILGPTGSGKTSLLDVLAGRKDKQFLTGDVLVDGERQPNDFRLTSGYVVQENLIMGTLTTEENLNFSADLRLPSTLKKRERRDHVKRIINNLKLSGVAKSKVGNDYMRGISGGEKKRTMIGMELITSPNILFLDEPTTGLDSATAYSVMALLKKQADAGKTIVFSIHQPRYSIFQLFDSLTLLSAGEIIYHGECSKALEYFQSVGYQCEKYNNPPDFMLDIISKDSTVKMLSGLETNLAKAPSFESHTNDLDSIQAHLILVEKNYTVLKMLASITSAIKFPMESNVVDSEMERQQIDYATVGADDAVNQVQMDCGLSGIYTNSTLYENTLLEMKPSLDSVADIESNFNVIMTKRKSAGYQSSFIRQFRVLMWRNLLNILRNPQLLISQASITVIFAIIIGMIYFQLDHGPSGLQNRTGVLLFVLMNVVFSNLGAVQLFIKDKVLFRHESASGYYRCSSYFVSKTLCDVLILRLVPTILYACITYWMVGLVKDAPHFFIFGLVVFITAVCACSLAFVISATFRSYPVGQIMMVLPTIIMLLFCGVFINLKTLPSWLNWLKYLSLFRYALATLLINELKNMEFDYAATPCGVNNTRNGNEYLAEQGIDSSHLWTNIIAIIAISLAFMILAYIQLRRLKKFK